uniref:Pco148683 n=1 Tax=Arundo donax TaxID=35708 RepID=A0A0A9DK17_ARUDO
MGALVRRAASLLRVAAAAGPAQGPPCPAQHRLPDAVCRGKNIPFFCSSGYSALVAPSNEVLIPPELLSSQTVWTPERKIGSILFLLVLTPAM